MSTDSEDIFPGIGLVLATFAATFLVASNSQRGLELLIAGLGVLAAVLSVRAGRRGNELGLWSLGIAGFIAISIVGDYAVPYAGLALVDIPYQLAMLLMILGGFPFGMLAVVHKGPGLGTALFWGVLGTVYMVVPLYLYTALGLTSWLVDVFDARLQFGDLAGATSMLGLGLNFLGMAIAGLVNFILFGLPAVLLQLTVVWLFGK